MLRPRLEERGKCQSKEERGYPFQMDKGGEVLCHQANLLQHWNFLYLIEPGMNM